MKTTAWLLPAVLMFVAPPPASSPTATATVALVAKLPGADAHAAILRRADSRTDVILLTRGNASVDNLAAALALLADVRGREGFGESRDALLLLKSPRLERPLNVGQRMRLEAHLARLRTARPRAVPGLGTVPAIDVSVRARARN